MKSHKSFILLATLIAIGPLGCMALKCLGPGISEITCGGPNVKCFAQIEPDGSVSRGCNIDNSCKPPNCLGCTADNCNLGLICKQCRGDEPECATTDAAAGTYNRLCAFGEVCVKTVNQNGTVSRGCGLPGLCDSNPTTCETCPKDVCNVGIFPKNRRQCYHCKGESCSTGMDAKLLKPCSVYQPEGQKCYTYATSPTDIQRGCQTDLDETNKCGVGSTNPNCLLCDNADGCNNAPYQQELGSCYKCSDDTKCVGAQSGDSTKCSATNNNQKVQSCYTQIFPNGTVSRGCTNELNGGCNANNNCSECSGDNCNNAPHQQELGSCYKCSDDTKCVGAQSGDSTKCSATNNNQKVQSCYTQIFPNGTVSRGCTNELNGGCNANNNCSECSGDNCNNAPHQQELGSCYKCSDDTKCVGAQSGDSTKCSATNNNQKVQSCYTQIFPNGTVSRGCTNELNGGCNANNNCSECSGDNCNNAPHQQELGSCYKCSDDTKCVGAQSGDSTKCSATNNNQKVQSCYTQIFPNGTVSRGCTNELNGGCNANNNCSECSGNNCNSKSSTQSFKCIVCRSDYYEPCREAKYGTEECPESSLSGPDAFKCFSGEWDGIVLRGCLSDASSLIKYQCNDVKDNRCDVCSGNGCNTKVYNGASGSVQPLHLGVALVGSLIVMIRQYV